MSWWRRSDSVDRVVSVRPSAAPRSAGGVPRPPGTAPHSAGRPGAAPRPRGPSSRNWAIGAMGWAAALAAVLGLAGLLLFLIAQTRADQQGAPASGTDEARASVERGTGRTTDNAFISEDSCFSIDAPGQPQALPRTGSGDDWDHRLSFSGKSAGATFWIQVFASWSSGSSSDATRVSNWLDGVVEGYRSDGVPVQSVRRRTLDGRRCVVVRSRQLLTDEQEPYVVLAYWVAGPSHWYVIRGLAQERDWRRVSPRVKEIVETFECW